MSKTYHKNNLNLHLDCGGIGSYERLLEIVADPTHPDPENLRDWAKRRSGRNEYFDPEKFDKDQVNFLTFLGPAESAPEDPCPTQ